MSRFVRKYESIVIYNIKKNKDKKSLISKYVIINHHGNKSWNSSWVKINAFYTRDNCFTFLCGKSFVRLLYIFSKKFKEISYNFT
jgi:hypothetical protein